MKKRIRKISATLLSLCLLFSALGLSPVAYGITIPSEELNSLPAGDVQSFEEWKEMLRQRRENMGLEQEDMPEPEPSQDQESDRFIIKYKQGTEVEATLANRQSMRSVVSESALQQAKDFSQAGQITQQDIIAQAEAGRQMEQADPLTKTDKAQLLEGALPILASERVKELQPLEMVDGSYAEALILSDVVDSVSYLRKLEYELGGIAEYIQPDYKVEVSTLEENEDTSPQGNSEGETGSNTPGNENNNIPVIPEIPETPEKQPEEEQEEEQPEEEKPEEKKPEEEQSNAAVLIAVIDSDVDTSHPAIAPWIHCDPDTGVVSGWDFVNNMPHAFDESVGLAEAHGTQMVGVVADVLTEAFGSSGDADVRILPLKVFENNTAYTSDIIAAVEYAKAVGADIINASFGCPQYNQALNEAMAACSGALFVAAAGNARSDIGQYPVYPASFELDNILSVASLNADGGLSYFSNYSGQAVNIAARGRDVECPLPGGEVGLQSGTSVAAATVSGVAAVVKALHPDADGAALKALLLDSSDTLSNLSGLVQGQKRVNLHNARNGVVGNAVQNNPADDFDVRGYHPTEDALWQQFADAGDVVQAASGYECTLVRKANGTVWVLGQSIAERVENRVNGHSVTLSQVIGLTNVVDIAAGNWHNLALKQDGTVWAWGINTYGQLGDGTTVTKYAPVQVSGLTTVKSIAGCGDTGVAVKQDGTAWAWGRNNNSQVGDNTVVNKSTAVRVSGLTSVDKVSHTGGHGLALKTDGTVWAWGLNSYGQLGNGTVTTQKVPVQVTSLSNTVADISCASAHSMAVKKDGTVWVWGSNMYGQLGAASVPGGDYCNTPINVPAVSGAVKVAGGETYCLALKQDGTIWAWGTSSKGGLGVANPVYKSPPLQVSGLTGVQTISSGYQTSLALKGDGIVWAWGNNNYGQLGSGVTIRQITPMKMPVFEGIIGAEAKFSNGLALKGDGTVWEWGSYYAQDITNPEKRKYAPVEVDGLTGVQSVSVGDSFNAVLKQNGTVWTWGENDFGTLGNGTYTSRYEPQQVAGLANVTALAANDCLVLALKQDGTVWAWGQGIYLLGGGSMITTQLTPAQVAGLTGVASVAPGVTHNMVVKTDGTVWGWGMNSYYELGNGTTTTAKTPVKNSTLTNVKKMALGSEYSIALKNDGTVWAWGNNSYGQLGNGTTTNLTTPTKINALANIVDIKCHEYHCLALKSDGTVWSWGKNEFGQLGDGTILNRSTPAQIAGLTNVAKIEVGATHCLAVKQDGTVWAWGGNQIGQLGLPWLSNNKVPMQAQWNPDDYTNFVLETTNEAVSFTNPLMRTGTIQAKSDWDWFAVTPEETGLYAASLTAADSNAKAKLYNSALQPLTAEDGAYSLTANTKYYVLVDYDITAPSFTQTSYSLEVGKAAGGSGNPDDPDPTASLVKFDVLAKSMQVPEEGTTQTAAFRARVFNEEGAELEEAQVTYSLAAAYEGVSIDETSGEVTVTSGALPGEIQIIVQYGELSATATLILLTPGAMELGLEVEQGKNYYISLIGTDVRTFAQTTYRLTYSADMLTLIDAAAQTGKQFTGLGVIPGTDIEVLECSEGFVTFTCNKDIPADKLWSGVLNMFQFRALQDGTATISIHITQDEEPAEQGDAQSAGQSPDTGEVKTEEQNIAETTNVELIENA